MAGCTAIGVVARDSAAIIRQSRRSEKDPPLICINVRPDSGRKTARLVDGTATRVPEFTTGLVLAREGADRCDCC